MLDYLISLFDDANDFSWDVAKASHAILLCRMEQGEIKYYTEVKKLTELGGQTHKGTAALPQVHKI